MGVERPSASAPGVAERMSRVRRRDTRPEVALRSALHARGLRYRVDVRPHPAIRGRADLVFGPSRVVVYVDGCFWHACPHHGVLPRANREWWREKLEGNASRDRDTVDRLTALGWAVRRVWEHEDPHEAADDIESLVRARRPQVRRATSHVP